MKVFKVKKRAAKEWFISNGQLDKMPIGFAGLVALSKSDRLQMLKYFFAQSNGNLDYVAHKVGLKRQNAYQLLWLDRDGHHEPRSNTPIAFRPKLTQIDKFWSRVNKDGPTQSHMTTPCWVWTAGVRANAKSLGYGALRFRGKESYAHHVSWIISHRRYPKQWILHRCDFSLCVNPEHLYEGTPQDNVNDREARKQRLKLVA